MLRLRGGADCGQETAEMGAQTCDRRRSVGAVVGAPAAAVVKRAAAFQKNM